MLISQKKILGVIGIGLGLLVMCMLWSIVNTALSSIQKDLSANILELQWMMNCYAIFLCIPLLTMGKLGDAYGRKHLFLYGLLGMLIASLVAGFANHVGLIIACMGLYGLSGSIILPLSQALLVHQFPEKAKEKAVGLWSILMSLSIAVGPLVGGLILNFLGWRWIFFINVPCVLIALPIIFFFVEKEKEHHKPHCDWVGVGVLALIITALILAIMQGPTWGWLSPSILSLFALSFVALIVFIILELKTKEPLFRPDLFAQRSFLLSAIPNGCLIGLVWVAFFLIPLYLQNMEGYTPFETGLMLLMVTIPVVILSAPVSKLYRKKGPKALMLCGFSFLILSSAFQSFFIKQGAFWPIAAGSLALGLGWALAWGPSISSAISSLPHHLAGIASGMFTTLQEIGSVTSLALAGVIFRMVNHQLLKPHLKSIDASLHMFSPDQIASLTSNPVAVEEKLGNIFIIPWLQEAFLGGYQAAFWFTFGLSIFAWIVALFLPKYQRPDHFEDANELLK